MRMCAMSFVYVAGIAAMLCGRVSSLVDPGIECSKDKPQWAESVGMCKAEVYLTTPVAGPVRYGNAGYLRLYGTQMAIECSVLLNISYTNSITVEVNYEDITNHQKSARVLPKTTHEHNGYRYYTTTFMVAHPKPGAEYRCFCAFEDTKNQSKFCWEAQMGTRGIHRLPTTLPCRHETCRQSQDEQMCYENYATGDIHHTWSHNIFTTCPPAANVFEHNCSSLLNSSDTAMLDDTLQFYLDGSVVDSGSLYNVLEGESLALYTSCLPQHFNFDRTSKCFIIVWSMNKPFWDQQPTIKQLKTPINTSNPNCTYVHIDISYDDLPYKTGDHLLEVGCHTVTAGVQGPHSRPVKQIEFYINILKPIIHPNVDQSCSLEFDGQILNASAVPLPVLANTSDPDGQCYCNFTLVWCNPQVTVKHVHHVFSCPHEKTQTKPSAATGGATTVAKAGGEGGKKVTQGPSVAVWVWIAIAGGMSLLTIIVIIVVLYPRNKVEQKCNSKSGSLSSSKSPAITLDQSLFQNPSITDNPDKLGTQAESSSTEQNLSPIHNLVYMGVPQKDINEI